MYHVVLMAALATSAGTPNHCYHRAHCHSACYGCYGGYSGYSGFAGHGCHGCYGVPVRGYGCAGACYGYHGGCYGGWGVFVGDPSNGGCYGCYGVPAPVVVVPVAKQPVDDPFPPINPDAKKKPQGEKVIPMEKLKEPKKLEEKGQVRAKVTIEVPEGGRLFVDGRHINVAAGTRIFQTPPLAQGETYFYDIRIEITRAGDVIRDERRVVIRPGNEVVVRFPNLGSTGTSTAHSSR